MVVKGIMVTGKTILHYSDNVKMHLKYENPIVVIVDKISDEIIQYNLSDIKRLYIRK